jgi:hypothetical protein
MGLRLSCAKHAEAEDPLLGTKGRFLLRRPGGGGGLSLEGIGLGATARARLRPECPKIHLRPAAAATEDLARAWRTHARKERHPAPLDLLLAVLRQGLLALVDDKDLLTIV